MYQSKYRDSKETSKDWSKYRMPVTKCRTLQETMGFVCESAFKGTQSPQFKRAF